MNPVLVQCTGLGYLFNMFRGKPLVREGGTVIICHPLRDQFHPEHHPSYIEFFHRCLRETTEATELERNFEAEFARNPTYVHMYRYADTLDEAIAMATSDLGRSASITYLHLPPLVIADVE